MGTLLIKRLFCNGIRNNGHTHGAIDNGACSAGHMRKVAAKCKVGDKATATRRVTEEDVERFAQLSGDVNPIHLPQDGSRPVVHGAFLNAMVSSVIGTQLPGVGTLVAWQSLHFPAKCYAGECVTTRVEIANVRKIIHLKFDCTVRDSSENSNEKCVLYGEAKVVLKE